MMNRFYGHHMRALGFGGPILDVAAQSLTAKPAIRGREQQLIDFFGGVGSPRVGNTIRGVGYYNPAGPGFHLASDLHFGPLASYTGFYK